MKMHDDDQSNCSCLYNAICVEKGSDELSGAENERSMDEFFRKYYVPFLTNI